MKIKILLLLLVSFIFPGTSYCQNLYYFEDESNSTDNKPAIIKILSIRIEKIYSYILKKDNSIKDSILSALGTYGDLGNILKIEYYDEKGKLGSVDTYIYSSTSQLLAYNVFTISW